MVFVKLRLFLATIFPLPPKKTHSIIIFQNYRRNHTMCLNAQLVVRDCSCWRHVSEPCVLWCSFLLFSCTYDYRGYQGFPGVRIHVICSDFISHSLRINARFWQHFKVSLAKNQCWHRPYDRNFFLLFPSHFPEEHVKAFNASFEHLKLLLIFNVQSWIPLTCNDAMGADLM